ncbi:MAG: 3-oxoacyl-ACP reductase [Rhodospirillaceae bacterium TMED8]|nr:3-oxoacyl-ACP reductase [Magnetovibrio sp.]OUT49506.1 MAG: 3-oxoacyl-ACP reductase [Rhodospirillaceae bacterium TMED8]
MDLELSGKAALVTGASTGIGAVIAKTLAAEGARLMITARRAELLNKVADDIEASGAARPEIVVADLTVRDDVDALAEEATTRGPVDILINNAGASSPMTLADSTDEIWDQSFALNFDGPRRLTHTLITGMRDRKWGRIINLSGSLEPRVLNAAIAYIGATHLWSKGLSCEVAQDGVTINCVQPGRIKSEQIMERMYPTEESRRVFIDANIPIGYFGEPSDVANLVAYLASTRAGYITGAVIPVDGGMHYYGH